MLGRAAKHRGVRAAPAPAAAARPLVGVIAVLVAALGFALAAVLGLGSVPSVASAASVAAPASPSPPLASGKTWGPTYRVDEVNGTAFAWLPWRGQWQAVRVGLVLPEGTLVQCLTPTTLTFRGEGGRATVPLRTRFSGPAMFRLDPHIARETRLIDTMAVDAGDVANAPTTPNGAAPADPLPFTDAWRRESGIGMFLRDLRHLAADALKPLVMRQLPSARPIHLRNLTHEIRVKYPSDGVVFFASGASDLLVVAWDLPGDPTARPFVDLFVWRRDGDRGAPVLSTNAQIIPINVRRRGGYFLQIASPDHSYQSRPVYFVVE
jgi:hypothetical protein